MKVYIINLKNAKERRISMNEEIKKFIGSGLQFIFFDAVNAHDASQMQKFKKYYSKIRTKMILGRELRVGEIACYASHFSLWQECIRLNEAIVVLEDDVLLLKNFAVGLQEISQSDYDFVRLTTLFDKKDNAIGFIRKNQRLGGTMGYYITPNAASSFLKFSKTWVTPVDDMIDRYFLHRVPQIVYQPHLIAIKDTPSTIGNRNNEKPKGIFKITREIMRIYWGVLRLIFVLIKR